jgi:hypothetical protein
MTTMTASQPAGARGLPAAAVPARLWLGCSTLTPKSARHAQEAHTLPPRSGTLAAARLKVTTTLNATELLAINPTDGKPRVSLRIRLPDRIVTAEIASKSLRKAQTAIHDAEADSIALVLQGRLIAGDVFAQASLSAQPRAAKPPPRSGALEINHWPRAYGVLRRCTCRTCPRDHRSPFLLRHPHRRRVRLKARRGLVSWRGAICRMGCFCLRQ